MHCYQPKVPYMTVAEFEALGNNLAADRIPVWVDSTAKNGASEARLGTVSASSVLDALPANAASNTNDGDLVSAWSAAFGSSNGTITVDLGAIRIISAVKLHWDFLLYAKDYTVDVSDDGSTWTTIATAVDENGSVDLYRNILDVQGRDVRLSLTEFNLLYYRLLEFEVLTNDFDRADITTSVNEAENAGPQLILFPNPATDVLHFRVQDGTPVRSVQLFDLNGRLLREQSGTFITGSMDLSGLVTGTFMLVLDTGAGRVGQRFVKVE